MFTAIIAPFFSPADFLNLSPAIMTPTALPCPAVLPCPHTAAQLPCPIPYLPRV